MGLRSKIDNYTDGLFSVMFGREKNCQRKYIGRKLTKLLTVVESDRTVSGFSLLLLCILNFHP